MTVQRYLGINVRPTGPAATFAEVDLAVVIVVADDGSSLEVVLRSRWGTTTTPAATWDHVRGVLDELEDRMDHAARSGVWPALLLAAGTRSGPVQVATYVDGDLGSDQHGSWDQLMARPQVWSLPEVRDLLVGALGRHDALLSRSRDRAATGDGT